MNDKALSQEPCSNCCNGNQIEKAKLCQKSYLAGMEHKLEPCEDAEQIDYHDDFETASRKIHDYEERQKQNDKRCGNCKLIGTDTCYMVCGGSKSLYKPKQKSEPCEDVISRILKRMWNCRGKHTTSIDKVKMEQIIRDELSVTQKPIECDDAISREAAIDAIESWLSCCNYNKAERHIMRAMQSILYDLPSVTQKSGKWKYVPDDKGWYICSECNCGNDYADNFCPQCGAKMEREENNG